MTEQTAAPPFVEMRDTTRPWMIPPAYAEAGGAAMPYLNGDFAWPRALVRQYRKVIRISVTGNPAAAEFARAIDIERYDATVQDAPGFVDARQSFGHDDATLYAFRAELAELYGVLGDRRPRLIIATLDDKPWTPQALAADVAANWGVSLDPAWIWGIQNQRATPDEYWDTTRVYGKRDFYNPLISEFDE